MEQVELATCVEGDHLQWYQDDEELRKNARDTAPNQRVHRCQGQEYHGCEPCGVVAVIIMRNEIECEKTQHHIDVGIKPECHIASGRCQETIQHNPSIYLPARHPFLCSK